MRIVEGHPRHAALLARLWNASDAAWPQGLVHLRSKTAREAREWESQLDLFGRFMALEGSRPIGYVRLMGWWGSPDAAYVQWLNVDPKYHGRGVGKALLLKTIERTRERRLPRVDLHTWPGNDKAMPLYKRTGFMWVPGSHAYLQNYLPLLQAYGPAKPFFGRHDWYASLRRDLTRDFDRDELHGVDVFVYRFASGRDRMEAVIDRDARGVMAFEDNDLRAEAWIPGATLVEGLPGKIRWAVTNKTRKALEIRIEAKGPRGVAVGAPRAFVLRPRSRRELEGTARLPKNFRDTPEGRASPAILSTVTAGERAIPFRSGFRPKAPIEVSWEEDLPRLAAPGETPLTLVLRNRSGSRRRGRLRLRGTGLQIQPFVTSLSLPKKGLKRLPIVVRNEVRDSRSARIKVSFVASGLRFSKTLPIAALAPGGAVAYRGDDGWILEGAGGRVRAAPSGSACTAWDDQGEKVVSLFGPLPGPPFYPADLEPRRCVARSPGSGPPELQRTMISRRWPGIVVEQRLRYLGDRTLELSATVQNEGKEARTLSLTSEFEKAREHPVVTIPTKGGSLQEAVMEGEWPDMREDVPLDRLQAEGWIHVGDEVAGYGLVWDPETWRRRPKVDLDAWAQPFWRTAPVRIRPGERRELGRVWLVVSKDPHATQELWTQVSGRRRKEGKISIGVPSFEAEPAVVLASPAADVRLRIRNPRRRPLAGTVRLETAPGARGPRRTWRLEGVRLGRDWERTVRLRASATGVASARLVLEHVRSVREWPLPVVASDGRGTTRLVRSRGIASLSNGLLSFRVAASHGGALTSLTAGRHEYLFSSYPKVGSFSWFRPFYGGILPMLVSEDWPGDLYRERFLLRPARRGTWTGIAADTHTGRSSLPKGLWVRVEYLTRPESPILAVALSVRNLARARIELKGGLWAFLGFDGAPSCEASFERLTPRHWRAAPWTGWTSADDGFAVFRAPRAPRSLALVAARPAGLEVFDLRRDGAHGVVTHSWDLAPREETTAFAALALVSPDEAKEYRVLRNLAAASFEATRAK